MISRSQNFKFALRVTAAVLLAIIAWGSTVEVSHGHAAPDTSLNAQIVSNCIETRATDILPRASVQETEPSRSSSRSNASSECLICQLHHNLATTLLSKPAGVGALDLQTAHSLTPAPVHVLEFTTAQQGRAPPVIL